MGERGILIKGWGEEPISEMILGLKAISINLKGDNITVHIINNYFLLFLN